MKPRLRPRSMISRRATSQMLRQRLIGRPPRTGGSRRDRLHEQLGELRRLVGERPDLAGRAGAGEQGVEVDVVGRRGA